MDRWRSCSTDTYLPTSAASWLKLSKWRLANEQCDKVLEQDIKNVKALFRKAQALAGMQEFEEAIQILVTAATLEPNNTAVRAEQAKYARTHARTHL